ncbi:MAG TPA: hypothetical protein VGJ83_08715 [Gemmatimonadales bacterium]
MPRSTHKKILLAAWVCAGLLGALMAVGVATVLVQDPDFFRNEFATEPGAYTADRARTALDSLRRLDFGVIARLPAVDRYTLPARRSGDGAATAALVWTDLAFAHEFIVFGDTFPDDDRRRRRWMEAAQWDVVDSLRAAALRSWRLEGAFRAPDSIGGDGEALTPPRVLSATRAVLARARTAAARGDAAEADTLARAAITIGRRLQRDHRLHRVLLGARIEREAFGVLAAIDTGPRTAAALARADTAAAVVALAYRSLVVAGALADHCPELSALARDPDVPLAVRHAAVLAIGYGWVFSFAEQQKIDARRGKALADLSGPPPLPAELREAVDAGRRVHNLSLFRRLEAAAYVRAAWSAWRWAG